MQFTIRDLLWLMFAVAIVAAMWWNRQHPPETLPVVVKGVEVTIEPDGRTTTTRMTEMTEREWLACADPDAMAVFLHYHYKEQDADRKLRLLACTCLRRIWHLLADERSRSAIEVLERNFDKEFDFSSLEDWSESEFGQAHHGALRGWGKVAELADEKGYSTPLLRAMPDAGLAAYHAIDGDLQCLGNASSAAASYAAPLNTPEWKVAKETEQSAQVEIIRRIFGNPFRPHGGVAVGRR